MKSIILIAFFFLSLPSYTQNVGIGTTTPTARLQVNHGSALGPGILLKDSTGNSAGLLRFQNLNLTKHISLSGFYASNTSANHFLDINSDSIFIATFRGNGNVGIGNLNPTEKLDVTGNINVTGSLKANGIAGQPYQVLKTNSSGSLSWEDLAEFKYLKAWTEDGTWIIPAGVTRILIEAWGGGGGGAAGGGGAGGVYERSIQDVTPGIMLTIDVGSGGAGAPSEAGTGTAGENTQITGPSLLGVTARGGNPANASGPGSGNFSGISGLPYAQFSGQPGRPTTFSYAQISGTEYYEIRSYGAGGGTAPSFNNGAEGAIRVFLVSSGAVIKTTAAAFSSMPGVGGAGAPFGRDGGSGQVIIHY